MDKIKIKTDNNEVIEMEVVLTYQNNDKDYVIYKDKENVHYIAKYNFSNDFVLLNNVIASFLYSLHILFSSTPSIT